MTFAILTAAIALIVTLRLIMIMMRAQTAAQPAAQYDLQIYRDQLAEVDRDLARGLLNPADADRVKTEISRRILEADDARRAATGPNGASRGFQHLAAGGVAIALIGGSLWLYQQLGAEGYRDMALADRIQQAQVAREKRPAQAEIESRLPAPQQLENVSPDYVALVRELRGAVAQRPDDPVGLGLLANHEMALGFVRAAHAAQARLIEIKGAEATAEDHALYADMLVIAANGYVSPEAEASLIKALNKDADNGVARYYYGRMMAQVGRPDQGFRIWAKLLKDSAPTDPWVAPVRAQIEELAYLAGVDYSLPEMPSSTVGPVAPALPGPDAQDVQNASELNARERAQMIEGMVEQLSERLATEGGSAQEWARLIGALGVLGQGQRAAAIWAEAQQVFAERPEDLAAVNAAAQRAGLTP